MALSSGYAASTSPHAYRGEAEEAALASAAAECHHEDVTPGSEGHPSERESADTGQQACDREQEERERVLDLDKVYKSVLKFLYVLSNSMCEADGSLGENPATLGPSRQAQSETDPFWTALLR